MRIRQVCILTAVLVLSSAMAKAQSQGNIVIGHVHGTVVFANADPKSVASDAPFTVIAFNGKNKSKSLVLSQNNGDYFTVLEIGHYCIAAYTEGGKRLTIDKDQLMCIDMTPNGDIRLDVVLIRPSQNKVIGKQ